MNKYQRTLALGVMLGALGLGGCADEVSTEVSPSSSVSGSTISPPVVKVAPAPVDDSAQKSQRITACQTELDSLQQINPKAYAAKKAYFDSLVKSASVYTNVRGSVNSGTKDTVDALYKYKTNQVCADIERDVMEGLIRKGESVK